MRFFPGTYGTVFEKALRAGATIHISPPVRVVVEAPVVGSRESFRTHARGAPSARSHSRLETKKQELIP